MLILMDLEERECNLLSAVSTIRLAGFLASTGAL